MKQLDKQGIVEYIRHAINMETNIFAQERIIEQFCVSSERKKPILVLNSLPKRKNAKDDSNMLLYELLRTLFMPGGIFIYLMIGITALIIGTIFMQPYEDGSGHPELGHKLYVIGLAIISITVIIKIIIAIIDMIRQKVLDNEYRRNKKETVRRNRKVTKHFENAFSKWNEADTLMKKELNARLEASRNDIEDYYSADIIFPKYRNLPALTSIYEYLTSGRCEQLTGANGAYNLYENELRQNTVISQLGTIITNLEQIRQNQYVLYEEISSINRNTQIIACELNSINGYVMAISELAALNTFYNGVTASCASAMSFYRTVL